MEELLHVKDVQLLTTESESQAQHTLENKLTQMLRSEGCAYDDIIFYWSKQDNGQFTLTGYGVWND